MSLKSLIGELDAFARGDLTREELRRWFTPYQVDVGLERDEDEEPEPWSSERDDQDLFWKLVWLFEAHDVDETEHRDLAERITACVQVSNSSATVLELLPLILARDRFCGIFEKHRRGIVSRIGFHSVIKKTFQYHDKLIEWLSAASTDNLRRLCELLNAGNYSEIVLLLSRSPA
jgi:hypothetical protein